MMLRSKLFALMIVTIFACSIIPANNISADNSGFKMDVYIEDAYYADLEGDDDTNEDDVYVLLLFDFKGSITYEFLYRITLTLPSGTYYEYDVLVSVINTQEVYIHNYFWDHATESGWYDVSVEVLQVVPEPAYTETSHTFDPPGGSENSDPSFGTS